MILKTILFITAVGVSLTVSVFAGRGSNSRDLLGAPQYVEALISQLNGDSCRFEHHWHEERTERCEPRELFASSNRRNDSWYCIQDAVECLKDLGPKVESTVPALIKALKDQGDMETGDGVIPIKSNIARALGEIGDRRAIEPLTEALKADELFYKLTEGASVSEIRKGSFRCEAAKALKKIGENIDEKPYCKEIR